MIKLKYQSKINYELVMRALMPGNLRAKYIVNLNLRDVCFETGKEWEKAYHGN